MKKLRSQPRMADIGGMVIPEYKIYSAEFQHLYRRYRTVERLWTRLQMDYGMELAFLKMARRNNSSLSSETLTAQRTPRWKVIQAVTEFNTKDSPKEPKFEWAPFRSIPNVRRFEVRPGRDNKLLRYFGINVKQEPEIYFSYYKNRALIRYAQHMITRLRSTKSHRLYWITAKVILTRSEVFGIMAMAKSFPRFHRELPMKLVIQWVLGSHAIFRNKQVGLEHTRVYIPKGASWRPLGVPKPVWRVALTQLAWILVTRYDGIVPEWQHGFRPHRGTTTAWKVVLSRVIKAGYIYEFDLKGFFDSVPVNRVVDYLKERGLPSDIAHMIVEMAKLSPAMPADMKLDETPSKAKDFWYKAPSTGPRYVVPQDKWAEAEFQQRLAAIRSSGSFLIGDYWGEPGDLRGFPQGANISPFLSLIGLITAGDPRFADIIMYADDGLFYSSKKFSPKDVEKFFSDLGLTVHPTKSRWVRENYEWKRPLKFLGLVYQPLTGDLWSSTREGVAMKFDKKEVVAAVASGPVPVPQDDYLAIGNPCMEYLLHNRTTGERHWYGDPGAARVECGRLNALCGSVQWRVARVTPDSVVLTDNIDSQFSWESLAKSRIWGLIQSRLYIGDWNLHIEQDFRLRYVPGSWVAQRGRPYSEELDFANSTSFAYHDIALLIKNSRRKEQWAREYTQGSIDLAELNRRRESVGWPPLKPWYARRLKSEAGPGRKPELWLDPHQLRSDGVPFWQLDLDGESKDEWFWPE